MSENASTHWSDRIAVGTRVSVTRTVAESDVYGFAGLTGDLNRAHLDAVFMASTRFGQRLVHGAYVLGLVSAASTELIRLTENFAVAYGHDRVRYLAPSFIGDTLTVGYTVTQADAATGRVTSEVEVRNQRDELVVVADHIIFFLDDAPESGNTGIDEVSA